METETEQNSDLTKNDLIQSAIDAAQAVLIVLIIALTIGVTIYHTVTEVEAMGRGYSQVTGWAKTGPSDQSREYIIR